MADPIGNLEIAKDLLKAFQQMSDVLEKANKNLASQVEIAQKLKDNMEQGAEQAEKFANAFAGSNEEISKTGAEVESLEGKLVKAADAARKAKHGSDDFSVALKRTKFALRVVGDAAANTFIKMGHQFDSLINMTATFGRGVFALGRSILAIPLGIFSQIASEASQLANRIDPVRQAMENVKRDFGDLAAGSAQNIVKAFRNVTASSDNLGKSGVSLGHIFGRDREGAAKALEFIASTAKDMGPVFDALSGQFRDSASSLMVLQKGMGLSGADMKAFGERSLATGESLNSILSETASLSLQMAGRFGLDFRAISKDMAFMTQNVGKFGSMTKTQMATASVFARKLGIEIQQLTGLFGAFDDFESAAQSASKLSQAFGMNVDAMKMMQEQDPTKRLDMLRQSFAATGRSIEDMTRQEKALLAQTAGLDENVVSLALSSKNMGMSYEDIQKESERAGKKQLSQAEIMEKVGKNIERVLENLNKTTSSFFQTFMNGFMKGIYQSKEFKQMMYAVSDALRRVFNFGMLIGDVFVKAFPGVKDMLAAMTEFFNAVKFKQTTETITKFFKSLSTFDGAKKAIDALFGNVDDGVDRILGFFSFNGPFMKGLKDFGTAAVNVITALIPNITNILADSLDAFIDMLPDSIETMFGEVDSSKLSNPVERMFNELVKAFNKLIPKIGEALSKTFKLLWENPTIQKALIGLLAGAAIYIFGPAALAGLGTAVSSLIPLLGTKLLEVIVAAFTSASGSSIATAIMNAIATGVGAITPAGWLAIAVIIATAYVTAIGQALKFIGRDYFTKLFSNDPNSFISMFAGVFYDGMVWASDTILSGVSNIFGGLFEAFEALIEGDSAKLSDAILKVLWGLGEVIVGAVTGIITLIIGQAGFILGTLVNYVVPALWTAFITIQTLLPRLVAMIFDSLVQALGLNIPKATEALDYAISFLLPWKWGSSIDEASKKMNESSKMLGSSVSSSLQDSTTQIAKAAEKSSDNMSDAVKKMSTPLEDIDISGGMKLSGNMTNLAKSLDDALTQLDTTDLVAKLEKYKDLAMSESVRAVVEDIKGVNSALEDLGDVRVRATVDRLGKNLKLDTEVLNIERKPIQLNVQLNLTMKAEDISKEIFEVTNKMLMNGSASEPMKQVTNRS